MTVSERLAWANVKLAAGGVGSFLGIDSVAWRRFVVLQFQHENAARKPAASNRQAGIDRETERTSLGPDC